MGFLARLFITGLGLLLADLLLSGVRFDGALSLWLAALLLGVINAFVRPLLILLTLPITLLTLGLFLLVVNGSMVMLVAWLMPSFHLAGLGSAILASVIVGLTGWLANAYVGDRARIEVWKTKR
ncbi:MAG TPA: phage holin family protein [Gemmatimonadales bacterium]|jgi:putative membrane protein|nr:phage holin family protein [Gemmatimonadales bacterium]